MGFVEAYECMTTKISTTEGNCVRRASWPQRLFLMVDNESYMDHAIDPHFRPKHSDRIFHQDVLMLCLLPPDGQEERLMPDDHQTMVSVA